jgi:hypothetical protein
MFGIPESTPLRPTTLSPQPRCETTATMLASALVMSSSILSASGRQESIWEGDEIGHHDVRY